LCRFSCPVGNATNNETMTPWGRQTVLHLINQGTLAWNRETANAIFQCTPCMLCREHCDHEIEVPPVMLAARVQANRDGLQPQEVVEFNQFFASRRNPFGDDLGMRLRGILPASLFNPEAQVVYFPGCSMNYNYPQTSKTPSSSSRRWRSITWPAMTGAVPCCGVPLQIGGEDEFKRNALALAKTLSKAKVIISGCPSCVHALKVRFPRSAPRSPSGSTTSPSF
jgi:Fe-S oxidoreductase